MENLALISLVDELKRVTDGLVVRRVVQHHARGFIFQARATKVPALKVWLDARTPALYISDARPPVDCPTTDFTMVLRKHLNDARLKRIEKPLSERIVEMTFKTTLPARELETLVLVMELLPNAPNMLLLDAQRRVLASFAPLSPQHGIGEYDEYRYPVVAGKLDLAEACESDSWFDQKEYEKKGKVWLIESIAGVGPVFAAEVAHRGAGQERNIPDEVRRLVDQLRSPSRAAWVYTSRPLSVVLEENDLNLMCRARLSSIELESLGKSYSHTTYAGILEAVRLLYDELESRTLLEQAKTPKRRALKDRSRKLRVRENRLLHQLEQFEQHAGLQDTAKMLVTSGAPMDQHHDSVEVIYYFGDETRTRRIKVDPSITLRKNVSRMFKRYQKANRGKSLVKRQLKETRNLRRSLEQEEDQIRSIKGWDSWFSLTGTAKKPRTDQGGSKAPSETARTRLAAIRIDGREVFFGRNGKENDELTFKVAAGDDFWFHVADYSGSHVIVRNPTKDRELEKPVLLQAAQLAAYHSQARNSSKVEVHYTLRRFVSKPRKAKPGLVRLREFKSITVEPKNWTPDEESVQASGTEEPATLKRGPEAN